MPLGMSRTWRPLRLSRVRHCTLTSEGSAAGAVPSLLEGASPLSSAAEAFLPSGDARLKTALVGLRNEMGLDKMGAHR